MAPDKLGTIRLIVGCMWSSKTTALTSQLRRYLQIGKRVLVVNHATDTRYGHDVVSTHDQLVFPCMMRADLLGLLGTPEFQQADAIFVDEIQFFPDAREFCLAAAETHGKDVVVAGLNGGFMRNAFQSVGDLLPVADEIVLLKALCSVCRDGTEAMFTLRKPETRHSPVMVGGTDMYEAVCRRHYLAACAR